MMIQFLLSTTLSRVCRVSTGGDSSSGSSGNSSMIVGGRGRDSGGGRGREDKSSHHFLTMVETIIQLISVGTNLVNLSRLRLLTLRLYLLQPLPPPLLLYRFLS